MRRQVHIAVVIAAVIICRGALAADLAQAPPPLQSPNLQVKVPSPAPVVGWSGPYVGAHITARYNAVDGNITSATFGTPATPIALPPISPLSWGCWGNQPCAMQYIDSVSMSVGLYAGWNWQVSSSYVVGVEADSGYANESSEFHGSPYPANLSFGTPLTPLGASPTDYFGVRTRWDGSARVRGGWLATPSLLLYGTGGLAWAEMSSVSFCRTHQTPGVSNCGFDNYFGGTLGPDVIEHSAVKLGWTVGFGIEVMPWQHWLLRAEYRFADFGYPGMGPFSTFTATDVRTCTGCGTNGPLVVTYQLPMMQHNFEFGLAYKFW
jgi:outer membrane immunogenic protein